MRYAQLRMAVQETWNSITVDQLNELIDTDSIYDQFQAVIDVNGKKIPY